MKRGCSMRSVLITLMAFICAFSGYSNKPNHLIYVKDCHGRFKTIYADKDRTIPLANPFISDRKGQFTFFTNGNCVMVNANGGNLWEVVQFPTE